VRSVGGINMLQGLDDLVQEFLGRADAAQDKANRTDDLRLKADYEDIARRWRQLADSHQYIATVQRFLAEADRLKRSRSEP
jgi:hypothetical protein